MENFNIESEERDDSLQSFERHLSFDEPNGFNINLEALNDGLNTLQLMGSNPMPTNANCSDNYVEDFKDRDHDDKEFQENLSSLLDFQSLEATRSSADGDSGFDDVLILDTDENEKSKFNLAQLLSTSQSQMNFDPPADSNVVDVLFEDILYGENKAKNQEENKTLCNEINGPSHKPVAEDEDYAYYQKSQRLQNVIDDLFKQWRFDDDCSKNETDTSAKAQNQLQEKNISDTVIPLDVFSIDVSESVDGSLHEPIFENNEWKCFLTDEEQQALARDLGTDVSLMPCEISSNIGDIIKLNPNDNENLISIDGIFTAPNTPIDDTKVSFIGRNPKPKPNQRETKLNMQIQMKHSEVFQVPAKKMKKNDESKAVPPIEAVVSGVVIEAALTNLENRFDLSEEQKKLKEFLESQPPPKPELKTVTTTEAPKALKFYQIPRGLYVPLKCANCEQVFTKDEFREHICEFNSNHEPIKSDDDKNEEPPAKDFSFTMPSSQRSLMPPNTFKHEIPALRILRENQARIHRFFKEELKFDLQNLYDDTSSNDNDSVRSFNADANSVFSKKFVGQHECSLCDRKFVHASGLIRHIEKHNFDLIPQAYSNYVCIIGRAADCPRNIRVALKCQFCGRILFKIKAAIDHVVERHLSKPKEDDPPEEDNVFELSYETDLRNAILKANHAHDEQQIANENQIVNEIESSASQDCKAIESKDKYKNFLKMILLGCAIQCEFCDYLFTSLSNLFKHSNSHGPEYPFQCKSCDIFVCARKDILTHFQTECVFVREDLKALQISLPHLYICNLCGDKFQTMEKLYDHRYCQYHFYPRQNREFKQLQVPCEYCKYTYSKASAFVRHYDMAHRSKIKPATSKVPRDTTTRSADNGAASETRTNEPRSRLFLCEICGKSYTQSSHLWQHLRFHQGVKPFVCPENGCNRQFTIRPDLQDHIRKCHTGERPFHCLVCGKRFLTGSVFYQHRLIHRGERRYECEQCGKRFYRADALKNHNRIHTGEKPFGCDFCTKYFRQRGDRDKHVRARHSHLDENTRRIMQLQKKHLEDVKRRKELEQQQEESQKPSTTASSNDNTRCEGNQQAGGIYANSTDTICLDDNQDSSVISSNNVLNDLDFNFEIPQKASGAERQENWLVISSAGTMESQENTEEFIDDESNSDFFSIENLQLSQDYENIAEEIDPITKAIHTEDWEFKDEPNDADFTQSK